MVNNLDCSPFICALISFCITKSPKILVSEYVGHHKNVIAEIGGAKVNITVGVDQDTVVGEVYGVRVDMSKVHLFDAVSGVVV